MRHQRGRLVVGVSAGPREGVINPGVDIDLDIRVAGEGDQRYLRKLQARVTCRGGDENISFVGWLSGESKTNALKNCEMLVLPSHQENFGMAVVEAAPPPEA